MERKTIIFTVDRDSISPRTEQKAGVQGSHNITEVRFNVEEALVSGALGDSPTSRIRMQFIDGAGGFYSTGFLDVMSEILPDESAQYYVTCPIPNNVTNAGGLAYVYLVVTEIAYEGKKALESQVYISPPGKLLYTHSGVGSPSEYAYRVGITNALVNAEIFVSQAEAASKEAEDARNQTAEIGNYVIELSDKTQKNTTAAAASAEAAKSAQEAAESSADEAKKSADASAECLDEIKTKLENGKFKADQTYNPKSENPQSGKAVAEAVAKGRQYEDFFDVTDGGMISLKPQYRGKGSPTFTVSTMDKTFAISDNGDGVNGSLNHLLPKKLVIPTTVRGITVTSVAQGMFCRNEAIECIEWNENIKNIPIGCFTQAIKLKNITKLSKVEFVGNSAFIYVPIEFLELPSLKSIDERAFRYMPLVESINIGNITTLPRQVFNNCSKLARVVGGQGITEIPKACFSWTPSLKSIPNWNITNMGDYAFKYSGISLNWQSLQNSGCTFGKWATPLQCLPNVNINSVTVSKSVVNKLTVSLNQQFEYWANELIGENSLQPTKTFSAGCVFFAMMNIYCSLNNIVNVRSAFELQRMCNDLGAMNSFTGETSEIPNFAKALNLSYDDYFTVDNNSVQSMVNALSDGKYILFFVPSGTSSATGHVVVGYGVDKDTKEIYIHDSDLNSALLYDTAIREGANYRMPITNIVQSADRVSIIPYFAIIGLK